MLRICAAFVLLLLPISAWGDPAGTVRIVDADTWDVGGVRVRLFGIDAPELDQTCLQDDGTAWACGPWATAEAERRFGGRQAACEALDTDRYGRIVARCVVAGRDAGRTMVADGLALAFRRYSLDYDLDEKTASVARLGIHAGSFQRPAQARAARAGQSAPEGCAIKGNVSGRGVRIYHVPGQRDYDRTRISPAKGERWFCTEAEARAAGWRRARR